MNEIRQKIQDYLSQNKQTTIQENTNKTSGLFGVPLQEALIESNKKLETNDLVPRVVTKCIEYIEQMGLHEVGIYRLSGSTMETNALRVRFEHEFDIDFEDTDTNNVTSLLKQFIRELSEPLLTPQLSPLFIQVLGDIDEDFHHYPDSITLETNHPLVQNQVILSKLTSLVDQLPRENRHFLGVFLRHLGKIASNYQVNKMGYNNLQVVFNPTLQFGGALFLVMILHVQILFPFTEQSKETNEYSHSAKTLDSTDVPTEQPPMVPLKNTTIIPSRTASLDAKVQSKYRNQIDTLINSKNNIDTLNISKSANTVLYQSLPTPLEYDTQSLEDKQETTIFQIPPRTVFIPPIQISNISMPDFSQFMK